MIVHTVGHNIDDVTDFVLLKIGGEGDLGGHSYQFLRAASGVRGTHHSPLLEPSREPIPNVSPSIVNDPEKIGQGETHA